MILNVPFFSNTPDNTHCFQAGLKSVLRYYIPEKDFSFEELDKMSNKKENLWTWSQRAKINLIKMGFQIIEIENWDIDEFVLTGKKYLEKSYGKEIADIQEMHSDINQAIIDYKEYKKLNILENRIPDLKDITKLLTQGYLVCCNINSKILNNKPGYSGHFIIIIGYDKNNLYLHDPGLPPFPNRKVPREKFKIAWTFPNKTSKNLTAMKLK